MSEERIIFLDIDGVACTLRSHFAIGTGSLMQALDPLVIGFLMRLCEATPDTYIVVSSTWRLLGGEPDCLDKLYAAGVRPEFVHEDWMTPNLPGHTRGEEVDDWLSAHPHVKEYVIIDDDDDFSEEQKGRLVKTVFNDGLSAEGMLKAMDLLDVEHRTLLSTPRPDLHF